MEYMYFCTDNVFECVTIGIIVPKGKNTLINCIYQKCNGNLEVFNTQFSEFIENIRNKNKPVYICGDYNIDLLKKD